MRATLRVRLCRRRLAHIRDVLFVISGSEPSSLNCADCPPQETIWFNCCDLSSASAGYIFEQYRDI
jgi:hypothetical protein